MNYGPEQAWPHPFAGLCNEADFLFFFFLPPNPVPRDQFSSVMRFSAPPPKWFYSGCGWKVLKLFLHTIWKALVDIYCATSPLFACCEVKGCIHHWLVNHKVPFACVLAYANFLLRSVGVWIVYEGGIVKKGKPNLSLWIVTGFTWGGWVFSFLLLSGACILHVFINIY